MNNTGTPNKVIIHKNKKAFYDYTVLYTFEAGLSLVGTEVKSLRQKKANITEAYIAINKNDEAFVYNLYIPHYEFGNLNNHEERRKRKLLLHKKEILEIKHTLKAEGLTAIPLAIYFFKRKVKLEFALGKGKKKFDKRQEQAKKEVQKKIKEQFAL